MKSQSRDEMFGIRKGLAFYFNDFIDTDKIKELIKNVLDITGSKFTSKRAQGEPKIRLIRGGWEKVFDNTFKNSTFNSSNVLMFTDGANNFLQTTRIYMNLWNPNKMPSCILVNCMVDVDWDVLFSFMQSVSGLLNLQFASAGYDVVSNDFLYPGSVAYSLKFLQDIRYANSEWTEWLNPSFSLAANKGICCPNIIQFLPQKLWTFVEKRACQCSSCAVLNTGVLFDILDHEDSKLIEPEKDVLFDRLSTLYWALRPIIVPTEKPMFLKKEEWVSWQKRYE